MGYMRHHAIVVTGTERGVGPAYAEAVRAFGGVVSPLLPETINGYRSFLVPPDGSKERWAESDEGDARRAAFVAWLRVNRDCDWVEIQYGDDEHETKVVAHSDDGA